MGNLVEAYNKRVASILAIRIAGQIVYTTNIELFGQIMFGICFKCGKPLLISTHKVLTIGHTDNDMFAYHDQLILHCENEEGCGIGYLLSEGRFIEE